MLTLLSGVISTLDDGLKQIQQAFAWASATRRWCQTFWSVAMLSGLAAAHVQLGRSGGRSTSRGARGFGRGLGRS